MGKKKQVQKNELIIEELKKGVKTDIEIAKEFDVDLNVLSVIRKYHVESDENKEIDEPHLAIMIETEKNDDKNDFTLVNESDISYIVSVSKNCPDENVKSYIFEFDTEIEKCSCNYDISCIYETVTNWFKDNISFTDGIANQDVILYLSDNNVFNLVTISALENMKINTTIKVYENGRYISIPLFTNFDSGFEKSYIEYQVRKSNNLYIYKCKKASEINNHFYVINIINSDKKLGKSSYVFNNAEDAWQYFSKFIDDSRKADNICNNISIYLDECDVEINGRSSSSNIAKSFNFNL